MAVGAGRITGPMDRLYTELKKLPSARGSGIVAAKSGYHSSRAYNRARWPGNYSIQLSLDKQGPSDAAAAIDISLSTSNMKKYTARLRDALKSKDPRVASIKEFYGTLNGSKVYGLGKKSRNGTPYSTSADSSHLWHIHISIFRADVDNWSRLKGIAEVLLGTSLSSGGSGFLGGIMLPVKYGDKSEDVQFWQLLLERAGEKLPKYGADTHYGDETKAAVRSFWAKIRPAEKYDGRAITAHVASHLFDRAFPGKTGPEGPRGPAGKDGADGRDGRDATVSGSITVRLEDGQVSQ